MQGNLDQWIKDINMAADELKLISGIENISVVGLRFGASLSFVASSNGLALNHLVLWDPVVDGESYLSELKKIHIDEFKNRGNYKNKNDLEEMLGFPYTWLMQDGIRGTHLTRINNLNVNHISMIVSEESIQYSCLIDNLRRNRQSSDISLVPDAGNWKDRKKFDQALVVNKILYEIVERLSVNRNITGTSSAKNLMN